MHYGRKLKGLIVWRGVTIIATAEGAGVPTATMTRQLRAKYPDLEVCAKVLKYLRLPMDALFSERDLSPLEVDILGAVRKMPEEKQRALLDFLKR